jgi:8-amino-7-oxononanoate synthase
MEILDEAHATGVIGEHGRGVTDLLPTDARLDRFIKVGTLSKALGAQGGFVVGSRTLIDYLANFARPYVFSTALAPPAAAAAREAIRVVQEQPQQGRRLLDQASQLRTELRELGHDVGVSVCQIIPVIVGESQTAIALSNKLREAGVLVPAIRPPSVPDGTARLRIGLTSAHTAEHVSQLVQALKTSDCRTAK